MTLSSCVIRLSSCPDQPFLDLRNPWASKASSLRVTEVVVVASAVAIEVASVAASAVATEVASVVATEVASVAVTEAASVAATEAASVVHPEVVSAANDYSIPTN